MKKIFFCVSLALAGLMTSCIDKNEEVDADSKPSWLGSSIYAELEHPSVSGLEGSFTTYLRLIDDLGEAETLRRTGSKTVFPANDDAFERFFQNNSWGVGAYEQLSLGQKKLLLYSSMLDNPLLLQLLPNVSNGTAEPMIGQALKHSTNVSVIDSVQHLSGRDQMPKNNPYWEQFYDTGIDLVSDGTRPMMVHLTREYMINNGITTLGKGSDFELLTGVPYPEDGGKTAFIYNDQVMVADVTCQNGYIHQMKDVVVPPGNMAQVLRSKENVSYFSHVLDYFAVPVFDQKTTNNYNLWARSQSPALPDKDIYVLRYLSRRSYDSENEVVDALTRYGGRNISNVLNFDPGWNQYYPRPANENNSIDYKIMDMGAFFVPSNEAMVNYFTQKSALEKGPGSYLIDTYGNYVGEQNTEEHLLENLDSIHSKNPQVLTAYVNNLMKASFAASVPSKFETVLNDASENMGLDIDSLQKTTDGRYDITFANNGAIYVTKTLFAPDEYNAVLAPASVYPDMQVMNWAVQDRTPTSGNPNAWSLGVDFKFYLLSMSSNYAFFIPDDAAFDLYYLDPASMGHRKDNLINGALQPSLLHFYYDNEKKTEPKLICERQHFNLATGAFEGNPESEEISAVKTQLVDILNYHTLVLPSDRIGDNLVTIGYDGRKYYKTKHGAEVKVDGHRLGGKIVSGAQIEYPELFGGSEITKIYPEKNGNAYRIDHVIQPTVTSVYSALDTLKHAQFAEFVGLCLDLYTPEVLDWAGISSVRQGTGTNPQGPSEQDAYTIFTPDYRVGSSVTYNACLDMNVKMFNTYNYTLFAPDSVAMAKAYDKGLPHWSDVVALYDKYKDKEDSDVSDQEQSDKDEARAMIDAIRDFIRYHFVMGSVYADEVIDLTTPRCKTLTSDEYGVAREVRISGGSGLLSVTDGTGHTVAVNAADTKKMVNQMARDYWFDRARESAKSIVTSSFCVVHQISEPLAPTSSYYSARRNR